MNATTHADSDYAVFGACPRRL